MTARIDGVGLRQEIVNTVLVLDRPLQEAAARRQVHDVVLVDPRRAGQQRDRVHLLSLRRVLDQFHELVPEHHLALGRGQVLTERERAPVHLLRAAAVAGQVVGELRPRPARSRPRFRRRVSAPPGSSAGSCCGHCSAAEAAGPPGLSRAVRRASPAGSASFEDGGDALAAADAHRDQAVPAAGAARSGHISSPALTAHVCPVM